MVDAAQTLRLLDLEGSYQVHTAPRLLSIDQRAHQVFCGFGGCESELRSVLRRRFPETHSIWLCATDGARSEITVADLETTPILDRDVVVPAIESDHAGGLDGLVWVVDRLLGPGGCPWDQEQTHESLKKHLVEEVYELIDAIDRRDEPGMKEELGDVLLQPIMHAQMQSLAGNWHIDDVAADITEKLVRRHPHVFGEGDAKTTGEVLQNWDRIKSEEKGSEDRSALGGVPQAMPALLRAHELSVRAARSGFEWPDIDSVWEKFDEERNELRAAIQSGADESITDEVGDLLFTVVNLARWLGVEPEDALRRMLDRFAARFAWMERSAQRPLADLTAEEWDKLWESAKKEAL